MNDDAKKALVDFQLSRLDRAEKVREEAEKAPRGISSFVSVLLLVGAGAFVAAWSTFDVTGSLSMGFIIVLVWGLSEIRRIDKRIDAVLKVIEFSKEDSE